MERLNYLDFAQELERIFNELFEIEMPKFEADHPVDNPSVEVVRLDFKHDELSIELLTEDRDVEHSPYASYRTDDTETPFRNKVTKAAEALLALFLSDGKSVDFDTRDLMDAIIAEEFVTFGIWDGEWSKIELTDEFT